MRYGNVELHNVRAVLERAEGAVDLSRVPESLRAQLNDGAQQAALNGCGCEIRFNLVGLSATIWLQRGPAALCDPIGVAEVWFGPFQGSYEICPRLIGPQPTALTIAYPEQIELLTRIAAERRLPFDPRLVRVLLPYDIPTYLVRIEGDVAPPRVGQTPPQRLLAYGSSITHGGNAIAPSQSYALRVARTLGYDLLNFGFAGSAQCDAALADYLADELAWDVATFELGINVLDQWSVAEFSAKAKHFISRIARRHPERWIFCTDILTSAGDFQNHPRLTGYRAAVREIVAGLALPRLVYLDGRTLLPDPLDLTSDLVHPAASGMEQIAARLARQMRQRLELNQREGIAAA